MSRKENVLGEIGSRYEVRRLTAEDIEWASALGMYTTIFHSPLWTKVFTSDTTALAYKLFNAGAPLLAHIIPDGFCFGVFDREYQFKRSESAATGGKLYWDHTRTDKSKEELEDEMDFPLVHVAFAFNVSRPPPGPIMAKIFEYMPLWAWFGGEFEKLQKAAPSPGNDADAAAAAAAPDIAPDQILSRCGTGTHSAYMNQGIMTACSYLMMAVAQNAGYKLIYIDAAHLSVFKAWMNPPAPYTAKLLGSLQPSAYADKSGELEQLFVKGDTRLDKIQVTL